MNDKEKFLLDHDQFHWINFGARKIIEEEAERRMQADPGYVEISNFNPLQKMDIFYRLFPHDHKALEASGADIDDVFYASKLLSYVVFKDPTTKTVSVQRVLLYPNLDYLRIKEDAHEYAPNEKIDAPVYNTNGEYFETTIDSGELTKEELERIQKSPSYEYYDKHVKPSQPGDQE